MKWWDQMPWSSFTEGWVLSQLFHSLLSPSSRGSLVPLHFVPLEGYHLHIWGCWYSSSNLDSSLGVIQPSISHDIYSANKLKKKGDNTQPCPTPFPILTQSRCSIHLYWILTVCRASLSPLCCDLTPGRLEPDSSLCPGWTTGPWPLVN